MLYLVRTRKFLIFILFILQINLYNMAIQSNYQTALVNSVFYICIAITFIIFIVSFTFTIEQRQINYQLTIFGAKFYKKVIPAENIQRIQMKKVPDNRIAVHLKQGMSFVINDYKMKYIDDEFAQFADRNNVEFIDTRSEFIQKNKR